MVFHNILNNEVTWLFVAMILLFIGSYRPVKNKIATELDNRIGDMQAELSSAIKMKEDAKNKLQEMQDKHGKAISESQRIVEEAKSRAASIMSDAELKIKEISDHSKSMLALYKEKSDADIVNMLKNDVIVTVLSILEQRSNTYPTWEKKQQQNTIDQTKSDLDHDDDINESEDDDGIDLLNKIWN